jgi:hypothetical protein
MLDQTQGAQELVRAVRAGTGYAAGKLGTSEFDALCWYVTHRRGRLDAARGAYPLHVFRHMVINAGLFPPRPDALDSWADHMLHEVLPAMDLMVEWNPTSKAQEHTFLNTHAPRAVRTVLRALEPYYEASPEDRYTLALPAGAKVAVVTPFSDTVMEQLPKLQTVWPDVAVWQGTDGVTIVPVQTFYSPLVAGSDAHRWPDCEDWAAARDMIVDRVRAVGATHALIGCGALSLPIAAALKSAAGCVAIHTGGATQILFGIQGRRWDTHGVISRFYNSAWVRPGRHEIPERAAAIERGCYF